uniref:Uncharacterized protein n=1 Tax=Trypanosoma congolense (strain IL3000) TaxID=1068625 RepID=G0USZ7_TRYCI|nr:hypothetical protein, unlikely [Trypanosoma congolense IL3000]
MTTIAPNALLYTTEATQSLWVILLCVSGLNSIWQRYYVASTLIPEEETNNNNNNDRNKINTTTSSPRTQPFCLTHPPCAWNTKLTKLEKKMEGDFGQNG